MVIFLRCCFGVAAVAEVVVVVIAAAEAEVVVVIAAAEADVVVVIAAEAEVVVVVVVATAAAVTVRSMLSWDRSGCFRRFLFLRAGLVKVVLCTNKGVQSGHSSRISRSGAA